MQSQFRRLVYGSTNLNLVYHHDEPPRLTHKNSMTIQRTYAEYLKEFNDKHTDFKYTSIGPVAKFNDIWYSVNGVAGDIVDVRYPLNVKELHELYKEIE